MPYGTKFANIADNAAIYDATSHCLQTRDAAAIITRLAQVREVMQVTSTFYAGDLLAIMDGGPAFPVLIDRLKAERSST